LEQAANACLPAVDTHTANERTTGVAEIGAGKKIRTGYYLSDEYSIHFKINYLDI
jgi:hypothetical protein